jgi:hypothetical protein
MATINSSTYNLVNLSSMTKNSQENLSSSPMSLSNESNNEANLTHDDDANASVFYEEDEDDEDDDSWYAYIKHTMRSQAYNLIGLERFKLPPKKIKLVFFLNLMKKEFLIYDCFLTYRVLKRKFSLLHIKSTTPAELFERKLSLEEYGEALALAKAYDLDTDLVYQKQWRTKPITRATILDYLVGK